MGKRVKGIRKTCNSRRQKRAINTKRQNRNSLVHSPWSRSASLLGKEWPKEFTPVEHCRSDKKANVPANFLAHGEEKVSKRQRQRSGNYTSNTFFFASSAEDKHTAYRDLFRRYKTQTLVHPQDLSLEFRGRAILVNEWKWDERTEVNQFFVRSRITLVCDVTLVSRRGNLHLAGTRFQG